MSGYSVSSAGDMNNDGYDDIIIGAYLADSSSLSNAGESYVIFGKASGFTDIDLSSDLATSGVGFKVYITLYNIIEYLSYSNYTFHKKEYIFYIYN